MSFHRNIQYLQHREINKQLWDQCIDKAENGLIYPYSFYLDTMAGSWDGLMLNNYEAVMPLPFRKKFGFYYLYQPFVTAQLGLFGNGIDANLFEAFLKTIPSKFRLWELSFNHRNLFQLQNFHLYERVNYVLDLNQPYQTVYEKYTNNIKRNIKKAMRHECYVKKEVEVAEIIQLAKHHSANALDKDYKNFSALFFLLKEKSAAKTYGVFSNQNTLMASCVFFFSHNRAYYILVGNHFNGKSFGASHALIDAFIKDHAGQNLKLDFEGSDIKSLAFFYSGFGAKEEKYAAIKWNRLPWYFKWLKK